MTRSIFDPSGGETERSGSTFLGPAADNGSRMPPNLTDGKVSPEESEDLQKLAEAARGTTPDAALDPDAPQGPATAQAPSTDPAAAAPLEELRQAVNELEQERSHPDPT